MIKNLRVAMVQDSDDFRAVNRVADIV